MGTGWYVFFETDTARKLTCLRSHEIRSRQIPRRKIAQISRPESLYFQSFQRRAQNLPGTAGTLLRYIFDEIEILTSPAQFAYHQATFFLVRLLQQFTGFALDDSNAKPPADWAHAPNRKATEKIHILAHLTMYVKVSVYFDLCCWTSLLSIQT
jgi:hypothetical protein